MQMIRRAPTVVAAVLIHWLFAASALAQNCDCECPEGMGVKQSTITFEYTLEEYVNGAVACTTTKDGKVNVCGPVCSGGAIDYKEKTTGTCPARGIVDVTGTLDFDISADGTQWDLDDSVSSPANGPFIDGDPGVSAGCDQLSVTSDNRVNGTGSVLSFTIQVERGPCEPLHGAQSACGNEDGGDVCETAEEGTETQSNQSVGFLTGHKLERSTDIVVSLPGRDFEIIREYSSDPELYGTNPYWYGYSNKGVRPGEMGANWTANVFQRLTGDHDGGSDELVVSGFPIRAPKVFERVDGIMNVRFVARSGSNEYIEPVTVDHPQFGADVLAYRLRTPGGVEYDFARMPTGLPSGDDNGFGVEDVIGQLLFQRDAHGNTWCYEYDEGAGSTAQPFYNISDEPVDIAVLSHIFLNWKDNSGNPTWAARVDFLWNGIDYTGSGGDYSTPQWDDTDTDGVWDSGEAGFHHYGRVAEVRVVRLEGSSEVVTDKARYLYYEDLLALQDPNDCDVFDWSPGDLADVIVSTLVDDDAEPGDSYYERAWHYRYHSADNVGDYALSTSDTDQNFIYSGQPHQLFAVFYPEQIEFFADHHARLSQTTGSTVEEALGILRTARFDAGPADTDYCDSGTSWSDFFQSGEHWQTLFDVASKVISYDSSSGNRVATQLVNAGEGGGCGCGTAANGARLGKRFDYIYKRYDWATLPDGVPDPALLPTVYDYNGFSCQIVESHVQVQTSPAAIHYSPYRVESHDYVWPANAPSELDQATSSGTAWKVARVTAQADPQWDFSAGSNPIASASPTFGTGRRWVTLFQYSSDAVQPGTSSLFNAFRQVATRITPSAADWAAYAPATGTGSSTVEPTLPAVLSQGLVLKHSYSGGWRSGTSFHEGSAPSGVTPTTMSYSTTRPDLVTQIVREPGTGPTGDMPQETTTFSYGFHSGSGLGSIVAWVKQVTSGETMTQNGPDTAVSSTRFRMYDTLGQLRWEQDAHGTLTYREYDAVTGSMVLIVRDADPQGAYVDADVELPGDFPGLSSAGFTAPTGTFEELQDEFAVDLLGRTKRHTDPSGVTRYTRHEVRTSTIVEEDGGLAARGIPYMAVVTLPHELSNGTFDGPGTVHWQTAGGKTIRTSDHIVDGTATYTPDSGIYTLGTEVARTDTELLISGVAARTREWHTIGADGASGSDRPYTNTGSYVTSYEYDAVGRMTLVIDPEFGATEYQHDVLDRTTQVAAGVASWDSTGVLSTSTLPVSSAVYDSPQTTTPGVGNGTLTLSQQFDGTVTRETKHWYDFRDRRVGTEKPLAPHASVRYDDLNRVVEQATFTDATGFGAGVTPAPGTAASNRSAYTQTLYNNRGMAYRTRVAIDPTGSTAPGFLESNRWYDIEGLLVASWDPNGPATKTVYDALHRPSAVYMSDRSGDAKPGDSGNYTDATTLTGDQVVEQTEYAYVAANLTTPVRGTGQAELITHRMRLHDTSATGALTGATSVSTYTLHEFDDASRAFKTHAYGTNGAGFQKGTGAPNRPSDGLSLIGGALTSEVDFDLWGRQILSISPSGKKTFTVLDALSRQIAVVEGQTVITAAHIGLASGGGTWDVNWATAYPGGGPDDADRVTTFFYDGLGNVINRTAHLPDGSRQETVYEYGTVLEDTSNPNGSLVTSSRLLSEVRYPDETTGSAGTSAAYTVAYSYNRLGELRWMVDQNGTKHTYARDALGRVTSDSATISDPTIDDTVTEIATQYDDHGRVAAVRSKHGTTVINSVGFDYTGLHQIKTLTQNASGDTGGAAAEVVTYAYTEAVPATGGTGNYSRLASITYPNEQGGTPTLSYGYGSAGSIDDRIGRTAGLDVPGWTATIADLVDYTYLGASAPVQVAYPATTYGLGLDMTKAKSGADGAATGTYHGFDRFGRVVRHAWVTAGFTTGTGNLPDRTPLFARAYEYDMDSNRVRDYDARPGAGTAIRQDRDWWYQYDGLDRLATANRGRQVDDPPNDNFVKSIGSREWSLDILGNWDAVWTDADGDGLFENINAEQEVRTHNLANEITLQERPSSFGSQIVTQPSYDDAGNYAHNLNSTTGRLTYKHDAWNRLVKVFKGTHASPSHTVLENEFNGLNWRVKRRMDLSQGAYNGLDEGRTYYYSANWQILEEHVDTDLDDDTDRIGQQFWGVRYIDDAVARRVDRDGDGTFSNTAADNFFYLTDVMFSVRAITDSSGLLHTRLDYTPYGVAMHGKAADVDGDGSVSVADLTPLYVNANGGADLQPGDANYDPDAFLDGNNEVDTTAYMTRYTPYVNGGSTPVFNAGWIDNPTDANGPDNSIGYDGYVFDLAGATEATSTGLYMVRHRVYDPKLGRWLQRDPAGYVDGTNLYQAMMSMPTSNSDQFGLSSEPPYIDPPPLPHDDPTLFDPGHTWTPFQDPNLWSTSPCKPSHVYRNGRRQVFDRECASECRKSSGGPLGVMVCDKNTPGGKKKTCCVCVEALPSGSPATRSIIASCVRVHEEWHWNSQPDCDETKLNPYECEAYNAEYNCLKASKGLCDKIANVPARRQCNHEINQRIRKVEREMKERCSRERFREHLENCPY